jgi:hypothetical protein
MEMAITQSRTGFYTDAVSELKSKFFIENGKIVTELDGRIGAEADSFKDLVALERKSVIFAPYDGYSKAETERIRNLFLFDTALAAEGVSDDVLNERTKNFIGESDDQTTFRRLYASQRLLDANRLPARASAIAQEAVSGVDKSAASEYSSSAVMADQLADRKRLAAEAGRTIPIPKISESVLAKIMRGRIEELTGRSLAQTEDYPAAEIRFKRAVSVLPVNSAWWRSSMWRLGETYQKTGQDQKALESYVGSYREAPTADKRTAIEAVYTKLNGSLDGIEKMLTEEPKTATSSSMFLKAGAVTNPEDGKTGTPGQESVAATGNAESSTLPRIPEDIDLSSVPKPLETALQPVLPKSAESAQPQVPETKIPEDIDLTGAADLNLEKIIGPPTIIKIGSETGVEAKAVTPTPEPTPADNTAVKVETDTELKAPTPQLTPADTNAAKVETDTELKAPTPLPSPADTNAAKVDSDTELKAPTPQPSPADTNAAKVDTDTELKAPTPEPSPADTTAAKVETDTDIKTLNTEAADAENLKIQKTEALTFDPALSPSTEAVVEMKPSEKSTPPAEPRPSDAEIARAAELIDLGATRPRIVEIEKIRVDAPESKECRLVFSQERISVFKNGGSFGIVAGLKNYTDAYVMRARSDSPEDILIRYEPDIGSVDGRAFFVITSISEKTGEYRVTFETPCGTEAVMVDVR